MQPHRIYPVFLFLLLATVSEVVVAQIIPASGTIGVCPGPGCCDFLTGRIHFSCLPIFVGHLVKFFVALGAGFYLVGIFLGGYHYAIGAAFRQTESGKKQVINSTIGFTVMVLSYLIVDTVINALT